MDHTHDENDFVYAEFDARSYFLRGMRYDRSNEHLHLLTAAREATDTLDDDATYCLLRFDVIDGRHITVSELLPAMSGWNDYLGGLPDDYPTEELTFSEVIDFVGTVFCPRTGDDIGEAEIQHCMKRFSLSRAEAVQTIINTRKQTERERRKPDFLGMDTILAMCDKHECELTMRRNLEGEWSFELMPKDLSKRLVTDTKLFPDVAMETLAHLSTMG